MGFQPPPRRCGHRACGALRRVTLRVIHPCTALVQVTHLSVAFLRRVRALIQAGLEVASCKCEEKV
jgi:hypothetical protein